MRRFRSWFALAHIIAETSRLRVDRSDDEQQAVDVRPHALCQKPPAVARNHRASFIGLGAPRKLLRSPSWIADSGLCLLAQKARYVARHIRLRSRALSGSFARLLRARTARSHIQINGSLIPKRGIGQHAVDTALPLGGYNGFDRSVRHLSMPFLFHCQFIAHC
jgi:hypothetical protein